MRRGGVSGRWGAALERRGLLCEPLCDAHVCGRALDPVLKRRAIVLGGLGQRREPAELIGIQSADCPVRTASAGGGAE